MTRSPEQKTSAAPGAADEQMLNGLTRAETDATASVMGLVHPAAPGSSRALRAASEETPCPVAGAAPTEQQRPLALHPLDALLPEICQLLDTAREDFKLRGLWSEWDQSVRDRITAYNLSKCCTFPHLAAVPREPTPAMLDAGLACHDGSAAPEEDLAAAWRAMVDAAIAGPTVNALAARSYGARPDHPSDAAQPTNAAPADITRWTEGRDELTGDALEDALLRAYADSCAARTDKGPWHVRVTGEGVVYIESDDFDYDASLRLTGNFGGVANRKVYAEQIAAQLNAAAPAAAGMPQPVAWIEHHKGGDNLSWETVDHPYAKATPLYTTPATAASEVAQDAARVTLPIDTLWKAWSALEALWGHTKNNYQIAGPNWCAQLAIQDLRSVLQGAGVDIAALQGERHV
jgi:hypothetical protein